MKPDILGLQETVAQEFQYAMRWKSLGLAAEYEILAPLTANGKGIVCAALVKKGLLIGEPEWIVSFPDKFILQSSGDDPQTPDISVKVKKFSRPVLHFTIKPSEEHEATHVYVCHFKSKGPTKVFTEKWFRAEEAVYKKHQTNWVRPSPRSAARRRLRRCGSFCRNK